jgi:hypothetical protein
MKIPVIVEVEAPDDATHYTGELLDNPTWWKHVVSDNGVHKHWCWWRSGTVPGNPRMSIHPLTPGWYIHGAYRPNYLQEIPK